MRIIVTGLLLAVILAGCAKPDAGDGVATAGGQGTQTGETASASKAPDADMPFQHSKCMRENGLPDFPDPKPNDGGGFSLSLPEGTDRAKVEEAEKKCKQFMPNGGQPQKASPEMIENARKMAQCMRENGFPDFPDPDENGGISIQGGPGLDPKDPKFEEAHKKCAQFRPGGPNGGGKQNRSEG
jgi:hypothetical protein